MMAFVALTIAGWAYGPAVKHDGLRGALAWSRTPRSSVHLRQVAGASPADLLKEAGDALQLLWADDERCASVSRAAHAAWEASSQGRYRRTRQRALTRLLQINRGRYLDEVVRMGLPRVELPNRQDVPLHGTMAPPPRTDGMVADCALANQTFDDNVLDRVLLFWFRSFVEDEIGWKSPTPGITGLLEEGRHFMLRASEEDQQQMVVNVLRRLFTPVGPPIYKTFMSGIYGERTVGPYPWAPALTALVTPTFFKFLVGPSVPNRRKDGSVGGLVVEKCRFLQESGCKGLCVHQCKLPAQRFFAEDLGLPLTVSPSFETQECQWSFGEVPLPVPDDASMPVGCLAGCPSRQALLEAKACNSCS